MIFDEVLLVDEVLETAFHGRNLWRVT